MDFIIIMNFHWSSSDLNCQPCNPVNGYCSTLDMVANKTETTSHCTCYNGFDGPQCNNNLFASHWELHHILLGIVSTIIFFYVLSILRRTLEHKRAVSISLVAMACSWVYHLTTFHFINSSNPSLFFWLLGYWLCGLYFLLSFLSQFLFLSEYIKLSNGWNQARTLNFSDEWIRKKRSSFHMQFLGTLGIFAVLVIDILIVHILVSFSVTGNLAFVPDFMYGRYIAIHRDIIQRISYAFYSAVVLLICSMHFFKNWSSTGACLIPISFLLTNHPDISVPSLSGCSNSQVRNDIDFFCRFRNFIVVFIFSNVMFLMFTLSAIWAILIQGHDEFHNLLFFSGSEITMNLVSFFGLWAINVPTVGGNTHFWLADSHISPKYPLIDDDSCEFMFAPVPAMDFDDDDEYSEDCDEEGGSFNVKDREHEINSIIPPGFNQFLTVPNPMEEDN